MSFWRHRIPTILGLLIIIAGIASGVYLVQKRGIWFLRAEPEAIPKQIKITNISENSFTVSWITEKEVLGFVKYGPTPSLEEAVVDERDVFLEKTTPYFTHHVRLENLKPSTKYYFQIGSGKWLFDDNGKPYETTTASVLTAPPAADTVYGTVLKPDGSPAEGVIVYLSLANSTPLSALSQSNGSWAIPLSVARTSDLARYITYDPYASVEEVFVQGGNLGTATAMVTTKNDSPVPTMTLGKVYDFRETKPESEAEAEAEPVTPSGSKFSLQPLGMPSLVEEKELVIINPQEGEKVATPNPAIIGTGPSNQVLTVTIQSSVIQSAEITVDADGNWQWSPAESLEPGEHTITVSYLDEKGKEQKLTRSFVILAAGEEMPAFTATPSAEATPSPTATPTAVPRQALPSTEEAVPEPGYLTPTFLVAILGTGLVLAGLFLNFKFIF